MFNPHEYDEHSYNEAHNNLVAAVNHLWVSGAEEDDITSMFESALDGAKETDFSANS